MTPQILLPADIATFDNPHLAAARDRYVPDPSNCGAPDDPRLIFICYTNRAGSNFLAESLASDDYFNVAGEYWNAGTLRDAPLPPGAPLGHFLDWVSRQEARNGWLVAKLAIPHLLLLHEFGLLARLLPRSHFIFIRRADLLGQAISTDIAFQTDIWHAAQQPADDRPEPRFCAERIAMIVAEIARQNAAFETFFGLNGIRPYALIYESVIDDPAGTLAGIGRWLQLEHRPTLRPAAVRARQQRDERNRLWRRLYLERAATPPPA